VKISIASDVHLEFGAWQAFNPGKSDVLVLAGDILVAKDLTEKKDHKNKRICLEFLDTVKDEFPHVIYIMGNHEHYLGDIEETHHILRNECEKRDIVFLDNQSTTIDGVKFIGGTMWTDCDRRNPVVMMGVNAKMNCFRQIKKGGKRFTTEDACDEFDNFISFVTKELEFSDPDKTVVISHHAPSYNSVSHVYRNMRGDNFAYYSDLDELIEASGVPLWIHGHTHTPFDYEIGKTRIICHPRGYVGYEVSKKLCFFPYDVEI